MSDQFHLSRTLDLPHSAITQTFAILAKRGAGKTHTASVMAEEMLAAEYPIVVLDPLGVWWGLRSSYPITILGGEHGDVPLEASAGDVVASFVVDKRLPVILDVSEFGENDMRRFVADFASKFYRANREPIHWFVDEADEFSPQNASGGGPIARCLGAMQNIVRRGRARGIGVTLISQRSAAIHKGVLTQTECLIAMNTTAPHDLRAIEDWLKYQGDPDDRKKIMGSITRLDLGEGWVYSPGWLGVLKKVKFRKRQSFDSSRTPEPGENRRGPREFAAVDLDELRDGMSETIERAKENDPTELRRRIKALEKELAAAKADSGATYEEVQAAVAGAVASERNRVASVIGRIADASGQIKAMAEKLIDSKGEPIADCVPAKTARKRPNASPPKRAPVESSDNGELPEPERRVLRALYWLRGKPKTPNVVAFHASYTVNGHFQNVWRSLRRKGYADGWEPTQAGIDLIAGDAGERPSGSDLREWMRDKLGGPENRLLDAIIDVYPDRITLVDLASATNYTVNGHFQNCVRHIRRIGLAEGTDKDGGIRAIDELAD